MGGNKMTRSIFRARRPNRSIADPIFGITVALCPRYPRGSLRVTKIYNQKFYAQKRRPKNSCPANNPTLKSRQRVIENGYLPPPPSLEWALNLSVIVCLNSSPHTCSMYVHTYLFLRRALLPSLPTVDQ